MWRGINTNKEQYTVLNILNSRVDFFSGLSTAE